MSKKSAVVSREESQLDPYPYVYMKNDGSCRELLDEEKRYLEEEFYPADGDRPYIKFRKSSRTPDGHLSGFIKRSICNKKWWQIWK